MYLRHVRLLRDALAHPTYGVNVQLPRLTLGPTDESPRAITLITDETRDGWVARTRAPEGLCAKGPVLAVTMAGTLTAEGEVLTTYRKGTVPLAIAIYLEQSDIEQATTALLYLVEGTIACLDTWFDNSNSTARMAGRDYLESIETLNFTKPMRSFKDVILAGVLLPTCRCRIAKLA